MTYATQGDPENQSSQSQPPTAPGIHDGLASVDALGEVPGANFGTAFWVEPFCARRVAISEMSLGRPLCCTSYTVFRSESPNVSCEQNLFEHPGQGPRKQKVVEGGPQSIGRGARNETFSQPGDPWRPPPGNHTTVLSAGVLEKMFFSQPTPGSDTRRWRHRAAHGVPGKRRMSYATQWGASGNHPRRRQHRATPKIIPGSPQGPLQVSTEASVPARGLENRRL